MKLFKKTFPYSFLFFTISMLSQEKNQEWQQLKEAAHAIGYCTYHSNMSYCNEHIPEKNKREKKANKDEDVYYFLMEEEWATTRVKEWATKQQNDPENYLIMFDILQGESINGQKTIQKPYNSFFILNLTDPIVIGLSSNMDGSIARVSIKVRNNNGLILENTLWREFISNRTGLIQKNISFTIHSENQAKESLHAFMNALNEFNKLLEK
ncbi:hypothetical protein [Leptobacterium sp. I13]|uniref:hypothetical protein n=1 Tax=Leptobacterium meishanense TaxID=3128904 RepID=UPI0030EF8E2B